MDAGELDAPRAGRRVSTLPGPPLALRGALGSHILDVARAAYVRLPERSTYPRDLAFAEYRREVRRIMRRPTVSFEVEETRPLASGRESHIVEIALRGKAGVRPGDMLYVWWRNDPGRLERMLGGVDRSAELGYWTTPVPHRPARRSRGPIHRLASDVFDLSDRDPAAGPLAPRDLLALPRITPRLYTVSGVSDSATEGGGSQLRIQVTMRDGWPDRAAAFLHRLQPGDAVQAWVMPHPHRVQRTGPVTAVVTGSGAAGVFAALRSGVGGIDLVWGLGDKRLEPWVAEEIEGYLRLGALRSFELVESPERVQEALERGGTRQDRLVDGSWLYVSGNASAGEAVDATARRILGDDELRTAAESLRYINSS